MWDYAHYAYLCSNIPSLAVCNLFAKQLLIQGESSNQIFAGYDRVDAGVGVASSCQIPSVHADGSVGNVANIVLCGLSVFVGLGLAGMALRRVAAVGKGEVSAFFGMYALTCLFQLLDTGAFINQGSAAIVWITAIHVGLVVAMFWMLLWVSFLSLQKVEDGTVPSYVFYALPAFVLFIGSTYIALDIGFSVSGFFDTGIDSLQSAWLFSLTVIWPAVAILLYYLVNIVVVKRILLEFKPIILFTATLFVFVLSQAARYALSHRICTGTSQKVDGSFLGTLLETATAGLLYASWQSITEDTWDDSLSALTTIQ